jgi:undecaprenyl diphosphate synthase
MRLPKHIGIIPDGNRRWANSNGIPKIKGWEKGIDPGYALFKLIQKAGIEEVTYYGYTMENARRPLLQRNAIINACIEGVKILSQEDAELLVVGNSDSKMFPKELLPYATKRIKFGKGGINVNFLINYGWEWDLSSLKTADLKENGILNHLRSCEVSKIDLIIRWGGWSRLSGFLPVQSTYADIYIVEELWPDFKPVHFTKALEWYSKQDITLGG